MRVKTLRRGRRIAVALMDSTKRVKTLSGRCALYLIVKISNLISIIVCGMEECVNRRLVKRIYMSKVIEIFYYTKCFRKVKLAKIKHIFWFIIIMFTSLA